jgi:hypothetical protein
VTDSSSPDTSAKGPSAQTGVSGSSSLPPPSLHIIMVADVAEAWSRVPLCPKDWGAIGRVMSAESTPVFAPASRGADPRAILAPVMVPGSSRSRPGVYAFCGFRCQLQRRPMPCPCAGWLKKLEGPRGEVLRVLAGSSPAPCTAYVAGQPV